MKIAAKKSKKTFKDLEPGDCFRSPSSMQPSVIWMKTLNPSSGIDDCIRIDTGKLSNCGNNISIELVEIEAIEK